MFMYTYIYIYTYIQIYIYTVSLLAFPLFLRVLYTTTSVYRMAKMDMMP